jgi:hypothetical protein
MALVDQLGDRTTVPYITHTLDNYGVPNKLDNFGYTETKSCGLSVKSLGCETITQHTPDGRTAGRG